MSAPATNPDNAPRRSRVNWDPALRALAEKHDDVRVFLSDDPDAYYVDANGRTIRRLAIF